MNKQLKRGQSKAEPDGLTAQPMPPPNLRGGRQAKNIDFAEVKKRAENWIVEILEELAPDGELKGNEYLMYNPHGRG